MKAFTSEYLYYNWIVIENNSQLSDYFSFDWKWLKGKILKNKKVSFDESSISI